MFELAKNPPINWGAKLNLLKLPEKRAIKEVDTA
jgi:hypothetical protein